MRYALPGLLFALVLLCTCLSQTALAQTATPPIPLPNPFTPIVDNANVIDPQTEEKLGAIYKNLKERANIEFAVVTIDTTGEKVIDDYAVELYRGWGIGSKENDGFLLLLAVKDRKYFTEIGYHLEGDLTDGLVGQIQREKLVPQLKKGNYSQAVLDTTQAYVATLAAKRGFSVDGIDQSKAYRETPKPRQRSRSLPSGCCMILVILGILIFLASARGGGGRRGGGGGGGWLSALLLSSLINSGSRSSGWGGSSSGWGGGGFGGGGFGGGGGGFGGGFGGGSAGGGGAGGSW